MSGEDLESLPGAGIVLPGIADLEAGRDSIDAIAVRCAATGGAQSASTFPAPLATSRWRTGSTSG
jgi:hypothetical protein